MNMEPQPSMDSGSTPIIAPSMPTESTNLDYFSSMFNSEDVSAQQKLIIMKSLQNKAANLIEVNAHSKA